MYTDQNSTEAGDNNSTRIDHLWKFFSVCEERQKFLNQAKSTAASFIIVAAGVLLTFISKDGIDADDLLPGLMLTVVGITGAIAVMQYDFAIDYWHKTGVETLQLLDDLFDFTISYSVKRYTESRAIHRGDAIDAFLSYFTSKEGLIAVILVLIGILGLFICLWAIRSGLHDAYSTVLGWFS